MILYPAIDILDGRAVRLTQGDFDARTVYRDDPLEAARAWVDGGARWLHVVDLDGARAGRPVNLDALKRIAAGLGVPVQCGGGLRSREAIDAALAVGAARVVVG
nr:HisA/HisF-related TIM barrel protein [Actinomycetota bacterium]